jgi:putative hemolysin
MKAWLLLAAMAGLTACQVPGSPYAGPNQPRVVPDGLSVTVVNVRSDGEAQPWADAYCAKQGRVAHFLHMQMYRRQYHQPTDSASFECIQQT